MSENSQQDASSTPELSVDDAEQAIKEAGVDSSESDNDPVESLVPLRSSEPITRRTFGQRAVLATNVFAILASLLAAVALSYGHIRASSINRIALDNQLASPLGEPGTRVLNVLLVGSDSAANLDEDDPIRTNRQGERLGDVVIIAHLDERTGDVALLSLPRDLWLPIGGSSRSGRINTTFALGGPARLIQTIEENFAIPIHHYVNVDFAGFKGLVEAVGSVDIYFDTPARDWNVNTARTQTGFEVKRPGCASLDPDQALAYVRSRYYQTKDEDGSWSTDPSSDLGRIKRQQDFLAQLMARSIEMGARNPIVLRDLVDTGLENVTIDQDLTPQTLLDLGRTFGNFEPGQLNTYSLPVAGATVSSGEVLIPIESRLDPVLRLFVGHRFDEPSTIGLSLEVEDEAAESTAVRIHQTLKSSGFELWPESSQKLAAESSESENGVSGSTQLTLYHATSDRNVADTVVAELGNLASGVEVVEDGSLSARTTKLVVSTKSVPNAELAFGDEPAQDSEESSVTTEAPSESEEKSQANKPKAGGSC